MCPVYFVTFIPGPYRGGSVTETDPDPETDSGGGFGHALCANVRETADFLKLR
jgi:hypothetical protein